MLKYDDDALPHVKSEHVDWRESYYCNFFDHSGGYYGIFWQGKRPNAGHGEAVFLLADGNGDLIRSMEMKEVVLEDIPEQRRIAAHQHFTCIEPWKHWRMRYEKGDDWFELDWYQLTDVCDWEWEDLTNSKHFQLAGKVHGSGVVGGRKIDFNGYGERDRSWGARNYGPLKISVWHTVQFPDDVAIHAFALLVPDGTYRLHGFLHKDGETRGLAKFDIDLVYESPKGPPCNGRIRYEDDLGRVVKVSNYQLMNYFAFGAKKEDGAQLGSDLSDVSNLMFLSFQRFTRDDGVIGLGMIDYNAWVGQQPASVHAEAPPLYSTLYKFGRE